MDPRNTWSLPTHSIYFINSYLLPFDSISYPMFLSLLTLLSSLYQLRLQRILLLLARFPVVRFRFVAISILTRLVLFGSVLNRCHGQV